MSVAPSVQLSSQSRWFPDLLNAPTETSIPCEESVNCHFEVGKIYLRCLAPRSVEVIAYDRLTVSVMTFTILTGKNSKAIPVLTPHSYLVCARRTVELLPTELSDSPEVTIRLCRDRTEQVAKQILSNEFRKIALALPGLQKEQSYPSGSLEPFNREKEEEFFRQVVAQELPLSGAEKKTTDRK